ncbi:VTC domain-containing protein [Mucor mucedo]|uniref:VTC domain-containing protein n=1 Tax=Mucor mucedo TaxID=29922 RepID=UPI0022208C80|nr:VTC domain-containing protein [Mucor mucedo]KAI7890393.1 VTC domain-containing protein [Mucor mucedo]
MKFGDQLNTKIHEPWRSSYLQYNQLKIELKRRQLERGWTSQDESEFSQKIESELQKVYQFVSRGLTELEKRTHSAELSLATKNFDTIADSLTEILFDANDLAKFHQLNVTGFDKIIKKHDRWTFLDLRSHYHHRLSHAWPLDKLSLQFDVLIVKISELHDICHLHGNPRLQQHAQGADQTAFERATGKYWIHPDNITEVKSIILFHLPVHVFNQKKKYEESDMAVSSVYFDNNQFDLYDERLNRNDGAESIRLRWYGPLNADNDSVYIERKTHKAAWLDGKSVKDRFRLKEAQVDSFISGQYTADQFAQDLRVAAKGNPKKEAAVEESHFVASGIQESVKTRHLAPVCRVFYNRTAFQLPGDQRLRISLDSNLTFIREDKNKNRWRRNDVDIDYPFRSVAQDEVSRFPYAVLETKLQTHLGQESPAWLTRLIESHLVHEVPRFSKYLHGASMLFNDKVPTHPYWLEHFDMDIRKAPLTNVGLSRSMSFKPLVNGHHRESLLLLHENENGFVKSKSLGDLLDFGKKSKVPHLTINLMDNNASDPPAAATAAAKSGQKDVLSRIWNYGIPGQYSTPSFFNNSKKPEGEAVLPRARSDRFTRPQVKKIEPKTFFANERTFISWLQFCALLLTVALNLLNNGDYISRIIGAVFIILSSLLAIYALARFQIRSWQLRTNKQIFRYDDVWGPTVLCILLVTALCVNFYLRADTLSSTYHEPN